MDKSAGWKSTIAPQYWEVPPEGNSNTPYDFMLQMEYQQSNCLGSGSGTNQQISQVSFISQIHSSFHDLLCNFTWIRARDLIRLKNLLKLSVHLLDCCIDFLRAMRLWQKKYKITGILRALSLVDKCVKMRVCKHGCDVFDSRVFWRNIL